MKAFSGFIVVWVIIFALGCSEREGPVLRVQPISFSEGNVLVARYYLNKEKVGIVGPVFVNLLADGESHLREEMFPSLSFDEGKVYASFPDGKGRVFSDPVLVIVRESRIVKVEKWNAQRFEGGDLDYLRKLVTSYLEKRLTEGE